MRSILSRVLPLMILVVLIGMMECAASNGSTVSSWSRWSRGVDSALQKPIIIGTCTLSTGTLLTHAYCKKPRYQKLEYMGAMMLGAAAMYGLVGYKYRDNQTAISDDGGTVQRLATFTHPNGFEYRLQKDNENLVVSGVPIKDAQQNAYKLYKKVQIDTWLVSSGQFLEATVMHNSFVCSYGAPKKINFMDVFYMSDPTDPKKVSHLREGFNPPALACGVSTYISDTCRSSDDLIVYNMCNNGHLIAARPGRDIMCHRLIPTPIRIDPDLQYMLYAAWNDVLVIPIASAGTKKTDYNCAIFRCRFNRAGSAFVDRTIRIPLDNPLSAVYCSIIDFNGRKIAVCSGKKRVIEIVCDDEILQRV